MVELSEQEIRVTSVQIAAQHTNPFDWKRKLSDHADLVANYIRSGLIQQIEDYKRCDICGMSLDVHVVMIVDITIDGQPGKKPGGWLCPVSSDG